MREVRTRQKEIPTIQLYGGWKMEFSANIMAINDKIFACVLSVIGNCSQSTKILYNTATTQEWHYGTPTYSVLSDLHTHSKWSKLEK